MYARTAARNMNQRTTIRQSRAQAQLDATVTLKQSALIERLAKERELAVDLSGLSKASASVLIGKLLDAPKPSAPAPTPGYYVAKDEVFVVVENKAKTGTYAKRMAVTDGRGKWVYAPGVGKTLAGLSPLTVEVAAALGRQYGICVICGRTLSDPVSVERGIGPICGGRL